MIGRRVELELARRALNSHEGVSGRESAEIRRLVRHQTTQSAAKQRGERRPVTRGCCFECMAQLNGRGALQRGGRALPHDFVIRVSRLVILTGFNTDSKGSKIINFGEWVVTG